MVRIAEQKHYTENKALKKLAAPRVAYIPLIQHIGKPCYNISVKAGDAVKLGQHIAAAANQPYAPIHSSVSGAVSAVMNWPHPVIGKCKTIVIENDGKDTPADGLYTQCSPEEIKKLTPKDIRDIVFQAGITGMGGASFPTHIKLSPPKPVETLIINLAECEPYLTNDSQLAVEQADGILKGIELIRICVGAKNAIIAVEDNKPHAISELTRACKTTDYTIRVLKSQYPQGGEKQLVKSVLGKEIPRGKLPFDAGVAIQNIGTAFAVYEAVYLNKPLVERVVTATGSCLADPQNLVVRIGTPIRELIESCGPLSEKPAKIIVGGPMMGIAQYTDEAPVIKSTTGVVLLTTSEVKQFDEISCIRCGACIRNCPTGLMPCLINSAAEKHAWEEAKELGTLDCVECGLCNFSCPSHRRIVQTIKRAKLEANR